MSEVYSDIFSEYDVKQLGILFDGDTSAKVMDTVGSAEESMEVRTVTKKKRNMPWKTRTRPTGSGEVKLSLHIPEDVYVNMFGMYVDGYKEGITVYGQMSIHKQFCMTELVEDEDANKKLKAYPCCTVKEGISRKVESNGEEVSEIELAISVDPDEYGNGLYQKILEKDGDDTEIKTWIEKFDTSLVKGTTSS